MAIRGGRISHLNALPELSGNCGDKIELLRESMG